MNTRRLHDGFSRFSLLTVRLEEGAEVEREVEDHGSAVGSPLRSSRALVATVAPS